MDLGDVLRRPSRDDLPTARSTLGAEINDPVRRLDHVEVVLDHYDRVAAVDEPAEHAKQLAYVVEMQAGRRLVQHVDRPAGGPPLKLRSQLDPLRLAARQGRSGLAEPDVTQADIDQRLQVPVDWRHRL